MESNQMVTKKIIFLILAFFTMQFIEAKSLTNVSINDAEKLMAENKVNDAVKIFEELAKNNDYDAQIKLAQIYDFGKGVPTDKNLALKWYEIAALNFPDHYNIKNKKFNLSNTQLNKGSSENQFNIEGFKAYYGLGEAKNKEKAFTCFNKASELGSKTGLNNIAVMYLKGDLGQDKANLGLTKLNEAVDKDSFDALTNLAWLYQNGSVLNKNPELAAQYFERAAAFGIKAAQYDLGFMYQRGIGLKQDYKKCTTLYALAKLNNNFTPVLYLGSFSEIEINSFKEQISKLNSKKHSRNANLNTSLIGSLSQLKPEFD